MTVEPNPGDASVISRFQNFFPGCSNDACDLLTHLLHLKPGDRMSANEALEHSYIAQFHDPSVERMATKPVKNDLDDDEKKSTAYYRDYLYHVLNKKSKGADSRR